MIEEEKIQRIHELVDKLNKASDAYYNGRMEIMSDHEWDALFDELKTLEEETGEILPSSPTQNVSEDNVEGKKEEHEFAALSLAKTKQVTELVKWAEGRPVWMSWKLDGLTLVVTYDNGRLSKVVTRGDGHIGTNITHLASAISGIPVHIANKGHIVIRGEAVISYSDFDRFIIESGEDYANPRNLASGSLTLKDIEEVKRRNIQWIPFSLVYTGKEDDSTVSFGARMEWLDKMGFSTVERQLIDVPDEINIQNAVDFFSKKVTSGENPFPVDGLVISYDDTAYAQTGSVTGHHATRGGLAFKWQDEEAYTELKEIEWSCAASTISPVAIFQPVDLEGTTVKRASLCNISECERLGIGGAGTKLYVIKANKIIPKVVRVEESVGTLSIPDTCPACGSPTEIVTSDASGTRTLHCSNPVCPAKQLRKYARFVSKAGMDIDGISEQTLAKFISNGWIHEYADIYKLRNHIREIASLEGFGEKSASNIMRSIDKAREADAERLLTAISIPKCGPDVAKRLLSVYDFHDFVQIAQEGNTNGDTTFSHIDGIGPERSTLITAWFSDNENMRMLNNLLQEITVTQREHKSSNGLCSGMTFVITGDVHHYSNRNELKAYIESQGGKVTGSVSKSTSFLINNDITSTSGKNKKAHELNIPILSEEEFINRFGNKDHGITQLSLF